MSEELDPAVALVVHVPDEYFSDDDDICRQASLHVCGRLAAYLLNLGHTEEDWVRGGCVEDACVIYETAWQGREYHYCIHYFDQNQMAIQFDLGFRERSGWKSWFGPALTVPAPAEFAGVMEGFGATFQSHRMLTKSEFAREY